MRSRIKCRLFLGCAPLEALLQRHPSQPGALSGNNTGSRNAPPSCSDEDITDEEQARTSSIVRELEAKKGRNEAMRRSLGVCNAAAEVGSLLSSRNTRHTESESCSEQDRPASPQRLGSTRLFFTIGATCSSYYGIRIKRHPIPLIVALFGRQLWLLDSWPRPQELTSRAAAAEDSGFLS